MAVIPIMNPGRQPKKLSKLKRKNPETPFTHIGKRGYRFFTFSDLSVGDTFDFISPSMFDNSFFDTCVKTSSRCYQSLDSEQTYRVGSKNAIVYHVNERRKKNPYFLRTTVEEMVAAMPGTIFDEVIIKVNMKYIGTFVNKERYTMRKIAEVVMKKLNRPYTQVQYFYAVLHLHDIGKGY